MILTDNPANGIDPAAPPGFGDGSLALTTNGANSARAQLLTAEFLGTPLASVTSLEYWTYQSQQHTGFADGMPGYQVIIDADRGLQRHQRRHDPRL